MLKDVHEGRPASEILTAIGECASESSEFPVTSTLGYSVASVITSLYYAQFSVDFRLAVEDVIALGGDTDTTAAMVGEMAGARFGFTSIPNEWYTDLHACGAFNDRIEGLIHREEGWHLRRELVDMESEWCRLYETPESLKYLEKQLALRAARKKPNSAPSCLLRLKSSTFKGG
jgi:hypothetical protein